MTLFYDGASGEGKKIKQKFSTFNDITNIPIHLKKVLKQMATQLKINYDELVLLLKKCSDALADKQFISEVLSINNEISEMSVNN